MRQTRTDAAVAEDDDLEVALDQLVWRGCRRLGAAQRTLSMTFLRDAMVRRKDGGGKGGKEGGRSEGVGCGCG